MNFAYLSNLLKTEIRKNFLRLFQGYVDEITFYYFLRDCDFLKIPHILFFYYYFVYNLPYIVNNKDIVN